MHALIVGNKADIYIRVKKIRVKKEDMARERQTLWNKIIRMKRMNIFG